MEHKTSNIFLTPRSSWQRKSETDPDSQIYVQRASELINRVFAGKLDKSGYPVVMHAYSVGLMGQNNDETTIGLLHDVLEDTEVTAKELSEMFPEHIVDAVKILTRNPEQEYFSYIQSIKDSENQYALSVKLKDLKINRLRAESDGMESLVKRYRKAIDILIKRESDDYKESDYD